LFLISWARAKTRVLASLAVGGSGLTVLIASAYLLAGAAQAAAEPAGRAMVALTPILQADSAALTPEIPGSPEQASESAAAPLFHVATGLPASAPSPVLDKTGAVVRPTRELDCLSTAVYYEARGEPVDGQAAVAQVVLNRARHPAWPKSVCGVVFQAGAPGVCQFSFVCNGAMRRAREPDAWARAKAIAARALGGYVMRQVADDTFFHAAPAGPSGDRGEGRFHIGRQVFYRPVSSDWSRPPRRRAFAFESRPEAAPPPTLVVDSGPAKTPAKDTAPPVAASSPS
jgi:spore germination cell wall hydrolase CwlJ-like protein